MAYMHSDTKVALGCMIFVGLLIAAMLVAVGAFLGQLY